MTTTPLTGFISFWRIPDGTYFMSDSYATEAECRKSYDNAEIDGYIDLSLIPPQAIKRVIR